MRSDCARSFLIKCAIVGARSVNDMTSLSLASTRSSDLPLSSVRVSDGVMLSW